MLGLEKAITYILNNISGLSAVNAGRNWDTVMPDNAVLPATTFQLIAMTPDFTMRDRSSLCRKTVQIQHWSQDKAQVVTMAEAVREQLNGKVCLVAGNGSGVPTGVTYGATGPSTANDRVINGILLQNELDLYDNDTRVFRRLQQFRVTFQET